MMNAMLRTPSARRSARSTGQSIYEVLLIIACAAMALAVIFAVYEYVAYYAGPTRPPPSRPAAPAPTPKMAPTPAPAVTPAPATTAAPTPAPTAAPGATTAPAAATTSG
jgi:hypothetical protein